MQVFAKSYREGIGYGLLVAAGYCMAKVGWIGGIAEMIVFIIPCLMIVMAIIIIERE